MDIPNNLVERVPGASRLALTVHQKELLELALRMAYLDGYTAGIQFAIDVDNKTLTTEHPIN